MGVLEVTRKLAGHKCEKCGHEWLPRKKDYVAKVCPKCKNPDWHMPKKYKR